MVLFAGIMHAQTTLISPTGDGGFENGATFAANGWSEVSSGVANSFYVGTATFASGARSAYISNNAGVAYAYTNSTAAITHFYRDITFPSGEGAIVLTFKLKGDGDFFSTSWYDKLMVFTAPTTFTPINTVPVSPANTITGATLVYSQAANYSSAYTTITLVLPSSLAGTTTRLIFSWHDDTSAGAVPGSVDDISLISRMPTGITSTAIGGLWSSPATWVGGAVPLGDDATIADGAIVTVDQTVSVRDLTVGAGASGILQWNATANAVTAARNVLINPGANLNMFTAASTPLTVTVNANGNFTNNGTVHAATSFINFPSANSSNLDGNGVFVGGIINQLFFQNLGNNTINTSQNLTVRAFAHTGGTLNTNGKLSIDNTAQVFGQSFNQKVYEIVVTAMGSGYTSAPAVTLSAPTGTGIIATATANVDLITGTVRSITITNPGDGYRANATVTFTGGGGTGATALAVVSAVTPGAAAGTTQKSGGAVITGGINIKSDQAVGSVYTLNGGVGYTSAPQVGFALPNIYLNLVTAGGSGYTSAPTVVASGGTQIGTTTTLPTFTTIVAQGKVVSIIPTTTGNSTLYLVPPIITISGGGGTGATAAYPTGCLPTATASINNGAVNNFTITNPGFGYTVSPTVGIVGGVFTTAATTPVCRIGLYNLTLAWFSPAPAPALHTEAGIIPANRRINILALSNASQGFNVTGNLELYNTSPLTFTLGTVDLGGNTLFTSHPAYAGTTGSATNNISNGSIKLSTPGGSLTRTFPFNPSFVATTGTGSLATGSTLTTLTATRTAAPSGTVAPSGNTTGSRAYRLVTNSGAIYGTAPTVTLNYDAIDALVADNPTLFIGQSAALAGPWTTRSVTSGTGVLSTTGTRTTATTTPGPIVPTGDDYYAWVTTYVPPTCAIPTAVATNTITTTTANVTWTSGAGSFIVEYGLQGFTPGTNGTAGVGGIIITSTGSPQALSSLLSNTAYDVYVRQDCTAGSLGYSPNSTVSSFLTLINCSTLPVLSCNTSVNTGNLALTGGLFSVSTCGFTTPGREKIYSFISTTAGTYTLNITNVNAGSGYNDYFFKVADGNCDVNTGWTCIGDKNSVGTTTFTLAASTTYYILVDAESAASTANHTFQIDCPAACPTPTGVATNTITQNTANVTFTSSGSSFIVEYGPTGFVPGTGASAGTGTIVTGTSSPIGLTGLTAATAYQVYVRQDCTGSSNGYSFNSTASSFTTLAPPPVNDIPSGAILLTLGAGCIGNPYTNVNATQSNGEPFPSCEGAAGYAGMWYSFVAPASGSVKISCDGTGTLGDTRMALFSATDASDYTTFSIITCDDDNGIIAGTRSLFYTSGLIAGSTYYVNVDLYNAGSTRGTYCVTIDELSSSMLSTTAADCNSDQGVAGLNATYTGWSSLVDANGNLSANVRQTAGTATGFSGFRTIKTGALRTINGTPYMNRNFTVNATGTTSADLQLFFTDAEVTALGSPLNTLLVSRVPGSTCNADFAGNDAVLGQTISGSANGVSYIQVVTPGFSNFYVRGGAGVLPIGVEYLKGTKQTNGNFLDWKVNCTSAPSVVIELQRSADSRTFNTINQENATALRCQQSFNHTDASPLAGINYYRLKITDPSGSLKYSNIVAILNKDKGFELISLAPNPVKDQALLTLTSAKAGKIEISISDIAGKVISKQTNTVISGSNPINMSFAKIAAGTYTIVATNADGEVKTTRFVKY
jgi:hypothetical protein